MLSTVRPFLFMGLFLTATSTGTAQVLDYTLSLTDPAHNVFSVRVSGLELAEENAMYQFAATAPGTYQVMDIGRFVRSFRALDGQGDELPVRQVSTNQWEISDVTHARSIEYTIAETWDTPVDEHRVYLMAGSSLEDDHLLFNAHTVIGFPTGLQGTPIRLRVERPSDWVVGTALETDATGAFLADDYDHLVDSPILMGRLSRAALNVTGVPVEIYVYSKTDKINASQLMGAMRSMLVSAGEFLGDLPVDRYTFLYHFEDQSQGAWEHSYSSEYVFQEMDWNDRVGGFITDIAAHEFFHIVTPLNIHSEIIEQFDFSEPVPSEHLWLYEGVTEWASDAMQLRSGLKDLDQYLGTIIQKMQADARFDADYSLSQLAMTSFTDAGQRQYGNIYQRGALVAGLLDIRLLELSGGTSGLRELVDALADDFGKERAFPEDELFDIITGMTRPEIGAFFGSYVQRAEPLPIRAYYEKLGIHLIQDDDGRPIRFEVDPNPTADQLRLRRAWMALRPTA